MFSQHWHCKPTWETLAVPHSWFRPNVLPGDFKVSNVSKKFQMCSLVVSPATCCRIHPGQCFSLPPHQNKSKQESNWPPFPLYNPAKSEANVMLIPTCMRRQPMPGGPWSQPGAHGGSTFLKWEHQNHKKNIQRATLSSNGNIKKVFLAWLLLIC